jgi:hypothetical protein
MTMADIKAPKTIEVNMENYNSIKEKHETATRLNRISFFFKGQELLCVYSKYLLEHMENVLKIKKS